MRSDQDRLTVVSLFCGLGGLDLGFQWEGYRTIWANDSSIAATDTYFRNFGLKPVCRDITQVPIDEIPNADVIIGGPPCQSFSLVGQRRPDDERGKLVFYFKGIIEAKQPRAFVIENVPGMAASRINGRRLPEVLAEDFASLGYHVARMGLMATDYLVPQRRKRLLLVGCKTATPVCPDGATFARECYDVDVSSFELSAKAALGDLGECVPKGLRSRYKEQEPSSFAKLMRSEGLLDVSLHEIPRMSDTDRLLVQHIPPGGNYTNIPDSIAPGRVLKFKRTGGRTTTYGRLHPDRPSHTINTYFRRPNVGCNFHYAEPRLITPREAMRFQSIPDHFELVFSSQDQRNALIGNAVPLLMARAVAWSLKKILTGEVAKLHSQSNTAQSPQQLSLQSVWEEW